MSNPMELTGVLPGGGPTYIDNAEPPRTVAVDTSPHARELSSEMLIDDDAFGLAHENLNREISDLRAWYGGAVTIPTPAPTIDPPIGAFTIRAFPRAALRVATGIALMRAAFAACVALMTFGLLLASFALATGAGSFVRGAAAAFLWGSLATITVASHYEGRRSGKYLLGERWSLPMAIFALGMVIVALVASIEFSLR